LTLTQIAAGVYVLASLVTFVFYGWDKRQARLSRRRIPEVTLHILELCGGWPGGLLGQRVFRHKTSKLSYQCVFWSIVVLHVVVVAWWLLRAGDTPD
jgi:uncharacterized membrane protein YsdA (DUF1294 family)